MSEWPRATFIDEDGEEYYWNFWVKKDRDRFIEELSLIHI